VFYIEPRALTRYVNSRVDVRGVAASGLNRSHKVPGFADDTKGLDPATNHHSRGWRLCRSSSGTQYSSHAPLTPLLEAGGTTLRICFSDYYAYLGDTYTSDLSDSTETSSIFKAMDALYARFYAYNCVVQRSSWSCSCSSSVALLCALWCIFAQSLRLTCRPEPRLTAASFAIVYAVSHSVNPTQLAALVYSALVDDCPDHLLRTFTRQPKLGLRRLLGLRRGS
jgi:hypothetical protein